MLDAKTYFSGLCASLTETKDDFLFGQISDTRFLEDLISGSKRNSDFFMLDDTEDGTTVYKGGAYFERRTLTIFLLSKFTFNDMDDRRTKLQNIRAIYRKLLSKLIKDHSEQANEIEYMNLPIRFYEIPGYYMGGTCGIWFNIQLDEPIDLVYNESDWNA